MTIENKFPPNPKLFPNQDKPQLSEEVYYAFLDTIEQINKEFYLRFDCVLARQVDQTNKIQAFLTEAPSIVIEVRGSYELLFQKIKSPIFYRLENKWMLLKTSFANSELQVSQYYNFDLIEDERSPIYNIDTVTLFKDMNNLSKEKVRELISKTTFDESKEEVVEKFFLDIDMPSREGKFVAVYNVGQGNCNAIVTESNMPFVYYDVGGGCFQNKRTYPTHFKLCTSHQPLIILSHWDSDHLITAFYDPALLNLKWLAPKQPLNNTTFKIAHALNQAGNLTLWNNNINYIDFSSHRVVKNSGNPNHKNNSGLSLYVNYEMDNYVILPGDAAFYKIGNMPNGCKLIGLVASHHGSRSSISGIPIANHPFMLAYSVGFGNTFRHPNRSATRAYANRHWTNCLDTRNGNIIMRQNPPLMMPPCRNRGCSLGGQLHY